MMIYQFAKPSVKLQPFIKQYWILEENRALKDPCTHRIYPSGFTELIFYYGDRYYNIDKNNKKQIQPFLQFKGQYCDYYDVKPTGKIGLIAITFKPDAAKMFFKIPISDLENNSVAVDDILGEDARNLEYELHTADDNIKRIALIEDFLINRLNDVDIYDYKRINYSLGIINQNKGIVSVNMLADSACLSTKHFNRKFTDFVGVKPKQFTRIVRFQNAIFNQQNRQTRNLTELAYQCGYYDQAHFTNEFKTLTGYTPKEMFSMCDPYSDYFS